MTETASFHRSSPALAEALKEMGIDPAVTRRVVIDIQAGCLPVIHVERFGREEKVIQVVRSLDGVVIAGGEKKED